MDERAQILSILDKFVESNSACCECNASLTTESTFINIHLGITLCRDCANVLAYLEGDYSQSFPYNSLLHLSFPLSLALYLKQTGNKRNKEVLEFHKPVWYLSPSDCNSEFFLTIKTHIASSEIPTSERKGDIKRIKKIFEEAKGIDDSFIDEYMDHLNDNYDKFWYYLDEKSVPPTKQGPYTRQEIVDLKFAKIIDDFSLVWHPLIGGWKVAAHVRLLGKNRKEPPAEVFNCLETLKQESSLQPVSLKQGYLHMQKKKHKELWKARWIVMTESSVIFYTIPNGKIKAEIKAAEAIITPKILQNKANALGFVIEIPQQSSNYLFWSPFQKEVLEWITELRKLKYLLGLGEISAKYILPCQCAYNETNLIVPIGLAKQK